MSTIYDWVSLAIFAGLVVLFLQRSTGEHQAKDAPLTFYLGAAAACALSNYLGNNGQDAVAILMIVATIAFIIYFLRPFELPRRP